MFNGYLSVDLPELDEELFTNLISGEKVQIFQGHMPIYNRPVIIELNK